MKNLRWYVAGLLTLATTLCYLDRQAFSIAKIALEKQYHWNDKDYALFVMIYTLAYGLGQPLAGQFIDRIKTRRGLGISVALWSTVSAAHALGNGLLSFSILRGLLGVSESGNFPAAAKAVSEWFPAKERAMATGIFNCGAGIGAMIAPPAIVWLILNWGWRASFIVTGSVGFLWVILWFALYHSPEKHPSITQKELDYIKAGQEQQTEAPNKKGSWLEVVTRREFWGLGIGRFLADPVWGFYIFWLPSYFSDARGFDLKSIGLFLWVPFLFADFGSLAGGWFSSMLVKRGYPVMTARKIAMCVFASLMPSALLVIRTQNPYFAIALVSAAAFGHQGWSASLLTVPADIFPNRLVASASGLSATVSTAGSMLFTALTGYLVTKYAAGHYGYSIVFTMAGLMHPLGAVLFLIIMKSRRIQAAA